MTYTNPDRVPAIRQHGSGKRTACPWCGEQTWIVSWGDTPDDNGRVQMYCDSPGCDSRETELIIVRGERANDRADVQALQMVDEGQHVGEEPSPSSINITDPKQITRSERRRTHRFEWRQSTASFTIQPSTSGDPNDKGAP